MNACMNEWLIELDAPTQVIRYLKQTVLTQLHLILYIFNSIDFFNVLYFSDHKAHRIIKRTVDERLSVFIH